MDRDATPPSGFKLRVLAAGIGFGCGLVEALLGLAWRNLGPEVSDPDLWLNWNAAWLAPTGLGALALGLSLPIGLLRERSPRLAYRLLPRVLIGLGVWSALGALGGLHPWARLLFGAGAAVRLGGLARLDCPRFQQRSRRAAPALAAAWLVLLLATGVGPATLEWRTLATAPRPRPGSPNVLLVVLDTVRAENLGLYGYDRATSPRLDARARGGVRFEQARATAPFTLGTHASLFTGRWMSETSAGVNSALDGEHPTLAEHLRDRGYATAGFVGNIFYGSARYGLNRGFLRYDDAPGNLTRRVTLRETIRASSLGAALLAHFERKWRVLAPLQKQRVDARELNEQALAWIDSGRDTGRPFFAFINYFDAHSPYSLPADAPQPFGRITTERLQRRLDDRGDCGDHAASGAVEGPLRDAYDDGIAWIDRQLDALLDGLDQRGLLANTLVIITADHGEMLGEHGLIGHGNTVHRPVVHVPLIVLGAKGMGVPEGATVERPVSLRDVAATVLDLLDDPRPGRFPGASLARYWEDGLAVDSTVLTELEHMPWQPRTDRMPPAFGPIWLITEGRWSYHRQDHETLGRVERLFDLSADANEERDLAADPAHRATLERLRDRLRRTLEPRPEGT